MCSALLLPGSKVATPTVISAPGGSPSRDAQCTLPKSVGCAALPALRLTCPSMGGGTFTAGLHSLLSCGRSRRLARTEHAAGTGAGLRAVFDSDLAVDDDMLDAPRILPRLRIRGDVLDRCGIEDNDVCKPAG